MINIIKEGIGMVKAKKLIDKINNAIDRKSFLSINWECYIKTRRDEHQLIIKYKNYENWDEKDLVWILKLIQAKVSKHNLCMYFSRDQYRLEINVDI